jgi:hypothetical protein
MDMDFRFALLSRRFLSGARWIFSWWKAVKEEEPPQISAGGSIRFPFTGKMLPHPVGDLFLFL